MRFMLAASDGAVGGSTSAMTAIAAAMTVIIRPCFLPGCVCENANTHSTIGTIAKTTHSPIGGFVAIANRPIRKYTALTMSAATATADVFPVFLSVSIAVNLFFGARCVVDAVRPSSAAAFAAGVVGTVGIACVGCSCALSMVVVATGIVCVVPCTISWSPRSL